MPAWGSIYWPIYLVITSTFFLVPELIAFFTSVSNTLSYYAWHQLNVSLATTGSGIHSVAWWLSFIAWVIVASMLTAHIWFRAGF